MSDERVAVKTYVPAFQKEAWQRHADELEMSQSEFVRTMVQAGRRDYDVPSSELSGVTHDTQEATSGDSGDENGFSDRILEALEREGVLDWDALVDALIDDVEADLDAELQHLQDENMVRYSGRDGGYVVVSDD
ncbi:DUF5805 domain-containing protein [Natrarchaeobaculum sulfurireducens]|uniref:Uncharacterized protein n=1 Tax=Natrarchaeobaculum sulfurireducens TaxID=2044521 RepID=A0A346PF09_9EURY|nr:DUF5805 domain-containing protein [Natrarchaeobaculum sulfurireducens]AXR78104.1 hypothetical protein AArc1_1780 [Natrarchaeobaculum sulfurireducens]AXR81907.1 hypothetical protein AArcMg_1900 [Natrarchaeobaculum sulfurireducens]